MAKSFDPTTLGKAISEQFALYHEDVVEAVNAAGEKAVKELVKKTKKTAPKRSGDYRKAITSVTSENRATGDKTFTWGAKAPHFRLTHLLVNGHQTVGGGRVDGDPFLADALEKVLPQYEKDVEEAIKNGN